MYKKLLKIIKKNEKQLSFDFDEEVNNEDPYVQIGDVPETSQYVNRSHLINSIENGTLKPDLNPYTDDGDWAETPTEKPFNPQNHFRYNNQNYHIADFKEAGLNHISHLDYLKEIKPDEYRPYVENKFQEALDFSLENKTYSGMSSFLDEYKGHLHPDHTQTLIDNIDLYTDENSGSYTKEYALRDIVRRAPLADHHVENFLNHEDPNIYKKVAGRPETTIKHAENWVKNLHDIEDKNYHMLYSYLKKDVPAEDIDKLWNGMNEHDTAKTLFNEQYSDEEKDDIDRAHNNAYILKQYMIMNHPDKISKDTYKNIADNKDPHIKLADLLENNHSYIPTEVYSKALSEKGLIEKFGNKAATKINDRGDFKPNSPVWNAFYQNATPSQIIAAMEGSAKYDDSHAKNVLDKTFEKFSDPKAKVNDDNIEDLLFSQNTLDKVNNEGLHSHVVKMIDNLEENGFDTGRLYDGLLDYGYTKNPSIAERIFQGNPSSIVKLYQRSPENIPSEIKQKHLDHENNDVVIEAIEASQLDLDIMPNQKLSDMMRHDNISVVHKAFEAATQRNKEFKDKEDYETMSLSEDVAHGIFMQDYDTDNDHIYADDYAKEVKTKAFNTLGEDYLMDKLHLMTGDSLFHLARNVKKPENYEKIYDKVIETENYIDRYELKRSIERLSQKKDLPKTLSEKIYKNYKVPQYYRANIARNADFNEQEIETKLAELDYYQNDDLYQSWLSNKNYSTESAVKKLNEILHNYSEPSEEDYWETPEYDPEIHEDQYESEEEFYDRAKPEWLEEQWYEDKERYHNRYRVYDDIVQELASNKELSKDEITDIIENYTDLDHENSEEWNEERYGFEENNSGLENLIHQANFGREHVRMLKNSYFSENDYQYSNIIEALEEKYFITEADLLNDETDPVTMYDYRGTKHNFKPTKVSVNRDLDFLKMIRHHMSNMEIPKKGISKGNLKKKAGAAVDKYPQIFDKTGRTDLEKVSAIIENAEKNSPEVNVSFSTWEDQGGVHGDYDGLQRHDDEHHAYDNGQLVVQINLTDKLVDRLEEEGVMSTFKELFTKSKASGHPVMDTTIGWARVDTVNSYNGHWHIDEIQSDFGTELDKKIASEIARYKEEHGEEAAKRAREMGDEFLDNHENEYKKISKILSMDHDDINHMIQSAIMQVARQHKDPESGQPMIDKVSFDSPEDQIQQSSMDGSKALPIHFINTYKKRPKKLGFKKTPKNEVYEDWHTDEEMEEDGFKPDTIQLAPLYKREEDLNTPSSMVKLNPEHGKMIADAYEQMEHQPDHPEVKNAYNALINETKKQYQDMVNSGFKISRIQPGQPNPYKNSKELHADIEQNNHLWYYPTNLGFGSGEDQSQEHPMLSRTGHFHGDDELLANDMFRIVHDYYGHHKGGKSGFGPKGEHRAFLTHKKMFSPLAQKALATETLGQNSQVNFGRHGEHNRANPAQTIYAEQKAGLLPDHIINGDWHTAPSIKKSENPQEKKIRTHLDKLKTGYDLDSGKIDPKTEGGKEQIKGKVTTKGMHSAIYSIPSEKNIKGVPKKTGHLANTVNIFGAHYPVVRVLNDDTILLHTSDYGDSGTGMASKTRQLVDKIQKEVPEYFPDMKIVKIHHPDYTHSARLMRQPNHQKIKEYLMDAAKNHPDEEYKQHALESHAHLNKIKKGFNTKPIHQKRIESEGWDGKKNIQNRVERVGQYLKNIGLEVDQPEQGYGRTMGQQSPTSLGINPKGDPADQQVIHEAAHAVLTPEDTKLEDYQEFIGSPGLEAKLKATKHRDQMKGMHGGGMPEQTAQHAEGWIARRSGLNPFRVPKRGKKEDVAEEQSRRHAKEQIDLLDEGIHRFNELTGKKELQPTINAYINAKNKGYKVLASKIAEKLHAHLKEKKKLKQENPEAHDFVYGHEGKKLPKSEKIKNNLRKKEGWKRKYENVLEKGEISDAAKKLALAGAMGVAASNYQPNTQERIPSNTEVTQKKPMSEYDNKIKEARFNHFMKYTDDNPLHPETARQLIEEDPHLNKKYGKIAQNQFAVAQNIKKSPTIRKDVYKTHFNNLYDKFDGKLKNIAHAWKHGEDKTYSEINRLGDLKDHPSVKGFFE